MSVSSSSAGGITKASWISAIVLPGEIRSTRPLRWINSLGLRDEAR